MHVTLGIVGGIVLHFVLGTIHSSWSKSIPVLSASSLRIPGGIVEPFMSMAFVINKTG